MSWYEVLLTAAMSLLSACLVRVGLKRKIDVLESRMDVLQTEFDARAQLLTRDLEASISRAMLPLKQRIEAQDTVLNEVRSLLQSIVNRQHRNDA